MSMIVVLIDHKHDVAFIVQLVHTNRRVLLIPSNTFWYDVVTIKTNDLWIRIEYDSARLMHDTISEMSKTKSDDEIIPSSL